jgi:hypothetical protein
MLRELLDTVIDALCCGHWMAHLVSWWRVVTGAVGPDDRVQLTSVTQNACEDDELML